LCVQPQISFSGGSAKDLNAPTTQRKKFTNRAH